MNIRHTLLLSFLLMGLAPATLLTGLACHLAREALRLEITRNLNSEASALMGEIDRIMFERVFQVHTWSHLELMQDVRGGEVDNRLSHFLSDLNKKYEGIYRNLICSNRQGKIVASSDASLVGKQLAGLEGAWLTAPLPYGEIRLSPLDMGLKTGKASLGIEATILDPQKKDDLGKLQALFDWTEIFGLLDRRNQSTGEVSSDRLAVLSDAQGRIIAASLPLRERGLLLSDVLSSWRVTVRENTVATHPTALLGFDEVLTGSSTGHGYQGFQGFGWTVQIYHPAATAFAPIRGMGRAFSLLLILTAAASAALSLSIAGRIARPVVQLTKLTRDFMQRQHLAEPSKDGHQGDVVELTESFRQMIRELEQSRDNLVRATKLAVVGEMAATMAHEVRTPLGIMRSSAQILQREPSLSETGREMLDFILGENDRLNTLISSLLDCARPRPLNFKPHGLHAIAKRVVDLLGTKAQEKGIRLICEFEAVDDRLLCDEEQILQVLLNLVLNAIQILGPGGEVTLRTFGTDRGLVINVDDNGPGIAESERLKVFDPFFTQREGGIGLGLTVVQQIIRAHGAEITVCASGRSCGARFHVFFPHNEMPIQEMS
jgi:two-component system sensor histidine kinase HydH